MTIRELIENGKIAIKNSTVHNDEYVFCSGEEFRKWLALSTRFMEQTYPHEETTKKFVQLAQSADGKLIKSAEELIGILEAVELLPTKPQGNQITETIITICKNFNRFERSIRRRYNGRASFEINDEYDLQDALRSVLVLFINDIRPEDFVPEYAGGKSRVDFHLPEYGIVIETKMASQNLSDKAIGDQLILDFQHYKSLAGCKHLICFVYDKNYNIINPHGLKKDLEKVSDSKLQMTVIVSPEM